jgi:hypothetical protein
MGTAAEFLLEETVERKSSGYSPFGRSDRSGYFYIKFIIFTSETEANKNGNVRWDMEISRKNTKRDVVNQKTNREREKGRNKD